MLKKLTAKVLVLMMVLNVFTMPSTAAEATDPDLVTAFVDHVFALDHKDQFVDLIAIIRKVDEKEDMLDAYAAGFAGLTSSQQDRVESFGITLDVMEAFVEYIMTEVYDEKKLENI